MKRIRPAPMGRAFRYVRRISHIEIELAERGKSGEAVANVVGGERVSGTSTGTSGPEPKPKQSASRQKQGQACQEVCRSTIGFVRSR